MTVDPRAMPLLEMADGVIDMGKTIDVQALEVASLTGVVTDLTTQKAALAALNATQATEIARLQALTANAWTPRFAGDVPLGRIRVGIRSDTNTAQANVVRAYWRGDQTTAAIDAAKALHTSGKLPWYSWKLPTNVTWAQAVAGAADAWFTDLMTRLNDLGKPTWVAVHHEPEGDGVMADWVAMQRRYATMAKAYPNIAFSMILTGWNQFYGNAAYSLANLWPGDDAGVKILGFDPYAWWGTVKNGVKNTENPDMYLQYWSKIHAFVKTKPGLAWAIAETALTDEYFATWPGAEWMRKSVATAAAYGAVAWTYFDYTLATEDPSWTWRLGTAKLAAFNEVANAPHAVRSL